MLGEIEPVRMDQVDRVLGERLLDRFALPPFDRGTRAIGDVRRQFRGCDQLAGDLRSLGGDDDRAMPGGDERPVQCRENLLGAADRVGTDRRQRITDAEDGQRHRGARPSRSSASEAARLHSAPAMPQPSVS